jgi:hypothetical protein
MFGLSATATIMKNALNNQYIVNARGIRLGLHLLLDELIRVVLSVGVEAA